MSYESIDKLQKTLADEVFSHTKDSKKAAGRALGTLVEIITYYLLKTWGLEGGISIERGLEEYGNPDIIHNVEYSLHPITRNLTITITGEGKITSNSIFKFLKQTIFNFDDFTLKQNNLLGNGVLRNACVIATSQNSLLLASIKKIKNDRSIDLYIYEQNKKPYAIFECKRVGVEEGMKKGPQTIEKAKQGSYVARIASSLQKIRTESGVLQGIIYKSDNSYIIKPFADLLEEIIESNDKELLRRFILTVGVVSNHGNWFTAKNQNKELKVLAQSYDWLLFLTDKGLSQFIENLLLNPKKEYDPIREAFLTSYKKEKQKNQFTKVQMNLEADSLLVRFFTKNIKTIENWFNIISPTEKDLSILKYELEQLKIKDWNKIL